MAVSEYLDSMDFTTLRKLMLGMAPEDVDKTEGSFLYDAVTPIALFVSEMIGQMKLVLEQSFIGTATGSNLDVLAATMPRLYRQNASPEKLKLKLSPYSQTSKNTIINNKNSINFSNQYGETFSLDTEQDDWISNDEANIYVIVKKNVTGKGSSYVGQTMEPSPAISGLETCSVYSVLSGGTEKEDDDHFRVRVWAAMSSPFLGSVSDYQRKIFSEFPLSLNGFNVENCFIIPRGSRSGYICVIPAKVGDNGEVVHCEAGELESLQDYLDKRIDKIGGYGLGVAPIGHVVKVRNFSEFRLYQRVTVTVARGRMSEVSEESVSSQVINATNSYLRSIINEVVPSANNYLQNKNRYVAFHIYYYLNAHEYSVLSTLRNSLGSDLIKNILIERKYKKSDIRLDEFSVQDSSTAVVLSLNNEPIIMSEYEDDVFECEGLDGNIFVNELSLLSYMPAQDDSGKTFSDKVVKRYGFMEQQDLEIKSGDSKGVLPTIGEIEVRLIEAEV